MMSGFARNDSVKARRPRISEKEWEVLKPLWEKGPMAARDIYREVPKKYRWAYETVKTMIGRLVKKGAVVYEQVGNSYLYRAAYSREEMTDREVNSFVQRVFDGTLSPFWTYFAKKASPKELREAKKYLKEVEKEEWDEGGGGKCRE